jgi:hypothetical protein
VTTPPLEKPVERFVEALPAGDARGNRRSPRRYLPLVVHAARVGTRRGGGSARYKIAALLWRHASPVQQLLAACATGNRAAAEALVVAHPGVIAGLTDGQARLIADKAQDNDTAAVALMIDLGFNPGARGGEKWEAFRWAAFHGNAEMLKRLEQDTHARLKPRAPLKWKSPAGRMSYQKRNTFA